MQHSDSEILKRATEVLDIEIEGLNTLRSELGTEFVQTVHACLDTFANGGKLVLTGVGKSGHISKKIAATLASTGSLAIFMHPVEAMHGDLGIVSPGDLVLAVSYSGETDELLRVLPAIHRLGAKIVAVTGSGTSRLAQCSDMLLPMPVPREACPFNLAPTTTTTALAALGDTLALVLLMCQEFTLKDYAGYHPAGAIGRSITLKVKDIMRTGDKLAKVRPDAPVKDGLIAMTKARAGAVGIVEADGRLAGIFTDGDFRRKIMDDPTILNAPIRTVMTPSPIAISEDAMAVEIMKILENRKIDDVLAVDKLGRLTGLVDIQDLPKFKVM